MPGTTQTHASTHALRRLEQRMRRRMRRRTLGHASFRFSIKKNIFLFCLNFFVNWNKKSLYFFTTPPLTPPPSKRPNIYFFSSQKNQWKFCNFQRVPPMLFYRKTAKIDKHENGTPYASLSKNSKIDKGTPYAFYRKTAKIGKYEKGTPNALLSKSSKNWQIWKGYPLCLFIENSATIQKISYLSISIFVNFCCFSIKKHRKYFFHICQFLLIFWWKSIGGTIFIFVNLEFFSIKKHKVFSVGYPGILIKS